MGAPVGAFSMHNNCARSVEEDCPKKQRRRRKYGELTSIGSTCGTSSVRWLAIAGRTNNRIRSLRFITFRWWNKIGEGSRQTKSVTLEKGLALRAVVQSASVGPSCDTVALGVCPSWWTQSLPK